MHDSDNRKALRTQVGETFVIELINALEEELELENPFIPEDEKTLLINYMLQDILQREGCEPWFDLSKINFRAGKKSFKGISRKDTKFMLH